MRYIITERQYKLLNEIQFVDREYGETGLEDKFLRNFVNYLGFPKKSIYKSVVDYFINVVGFDESEVNTSLIPPYLMDINRHSYFPEKFYQKDVISGLCYHLAKNFIKLKNGSTGLSYFEEEKNYLVEYYFFDDELEQLAGYCKARKFVPRSLNKLYKLFPKDTYQVELILGDPGYGKQMYMFLVNAHDCVMSDDVLFPGALNMWVNVLPKMAVVGYITDKNKIGRMGPRNKVLNPRDIDVYFASKNMDVLNALRQGQSLVA